MCLCVDMSNITCNMLIFIKEDGLMDKLGITYKMNSSEKGIKNGETRATFIVNKEQLESIKAIAYWERKTIKEVLFEAINQYLDKINNKIQKRKAK